MRAYILVLYSLCGAIGATRQIRTTRVELLSAANGQLGTLSAEERAVAQHEAEYQSRVAALQHELGLPQVPGPRALGAGRLKLMAEQATAAQGVTAAAGQSKVDSHWKTAMLAMFAGWFIVLGGLLSTFYFTGNSFFLLPPKEEPPQQESEEAGEEHEEQRERALTLEDVFAERQQMRSARSAMKEMESAKSAKSTKDGSETNRLRDEEADVVAELPGNEYVDDLRMQEILSYSMDDLGAPISGQDSSFRFSNRFDSRGTPSARTSVRTSMSRGSMYNNQSNYGHTSTSSSGVPGRGGPLSATSTHGTYAFDEDDVTPLVTEAPTDYGPAVNKESSSVVTIGGNRRNPKALFRGATDELKEHMLRMHRQSASQPLGQQAVISGGPGDQQEVEAEGQPEEVAGSSSRQ